MLGNLIGGFITILVGLTLVPTVSNQVFGVTHKYGNGTGATNVTGVSATLLSLTTLFFALAIAATGIAVAVQGLKAAGLLGI